MCSGVFVEQCRGSADAEPIVLLADPLVGRMRVFARKAEAHEQDRGAEYALEIPDDRDRATFTGDDGLATECGV